MDINCQVDDDSNDNIVCDCILNSFDVEVACVVPNTIIVCKTFDLNLPNLSCTSVHY